MWVSDNGTGNLLKLGSSGNTLKAIRVGPGARGLLARVYWFWLSSWRLVC
jgi:hypothetical protein